MNQQRAVKTREDLLAGAATEFAHHGYAASSINRILDNTACTKGAMYFHFASKREMAEAVLDNAAAVHTAIAERWTTADGMDPLGAIRGMVDDAGQVFADDVSLRAEARLSVEPEFSARCLSAVWNGAVLVLASRAAESGCLREGFTAEKFVVSWRHRWPGTDCWRTSPPPESPCRSGAVTASRSRPFSPPQPPRMPPQQVSADTAVLTVETVDVAAPVRRAARNARPAQV